MWLQHKDTIKKEVMLTLMEIFFGLEKNLEHFWIIYFLPFKVSVKENEVPTEKNSSRASIFATKASYISN